jgi:hypothetical protein
VPAGKVYGFRVRLKNTGNVPIESQEVFIALDPDAKMLSLEVEEAPLELWGRIVTERQHGERSVGRCVLPFLNPGQNLILSAQSVDNEAPGCLVYAPGAGLRVHDMELTALLLTTGLFLASLGGYALASLGLGLLSIGQLHWAWAAVMVAAGAATFLPSSVAATRLLRGRRDIG